MHEGGLPRRKGGGHAVQRRYLVDEQHAAVDVGEHLLELVGAVAQQVGARGRLELGALTHLKTAHGVG